MRIGIDAKWYYSGPPSSRVVIQNLVKNIFLLKPKHTFVIILRKSDCEKFLQEPFLVDTPVEYSIVPVQGRFNFLLNMLYLPILSFYHKIDKIVYLNYGPLFRIGKTKNITFIFDFLFLDYPQFFSTVELAVFRLMKILARKADHILTISHSEAERIKYHTKFDSNQVSFIYLAADRIFKVYDTETKNEIIKKYNLPEQYVLYVGRLNIRKNIPVLIKALLYTKNKVDLVIIGSKDLQSFDIDSFIDSHSLKDRVRMLGFIPDEDMAVILSTAHIFCYPSFAEGFGLPPLEALSSGTPVLTTNLTSIPEVCSDAAVYFDPNDASELADKLDFLLENAEIRNHYVHKGLVQASLFSWRKTASDFLEIVIKV